MPTQDDTKKILEQGHIQLLRLLPESSNRTFLVSVANKNQSIQAVYKPLIGERPLHDFPRGLYRREIAAYVLSVALNLPHVPITVKCNGPLGVGSLQQFIETPTEVNYFDLLNESQYHSVLQTICLFDYLANNADRKAGHCLLTQANEIYIIDHGLCFHWEYKLRTVIWDFAGEEIGDNRYKLLLNLQSNEKFFNQIGSYISPFELESMKARLASLIEKRTLPVDESGGHRWPWPIV